MSTRPYFVTWSDAKPATTSVQSSHRYDRSIEVSYEFCSIFRAQATQ